jgi:hypothetical protein
MLGALASIQNWAALTLIPLWLPWARCRPAFAAMNGQFIAISAAVYDASGGFAAVANSLAEDTALGRRLVGLGYRVRLADGAGLLTCCAYTRLADLWRANVRNMTAVLFGSPWALRGSAFGLATVYVAPFALLVIALAFGRAGSTAWTLLPAIACALAIGARALVERRSGHAAWTALLHPFTMAALVAMQLDAGCRTRARGSVEWRGRRYPISADVA